MEFKSGTTTKADGNWFINLLTEDRLRELTGATSAVWMQQVHGKRVYVVDGSQHGLLGDGDAVVTDRPGVVLNVRTADCVPVFMAGPRAIGLAHAGLAGVRHGILGATLETLVREYHDPASSYTVWLGPHICPNCYFVRSDVNHDHAEQPLVAPFTELREDDKTHIDLAAALRAQVEAAGAQWKEVPTVCTKESPDYYSHRGGDSGRQLSWIMITPTDA